MKIVAYGGNDTYLHINRKLSFYIYYFPKQALSFEKLSAMETRPMPIQIIPKKSFFLRRKKIATKYQYQHRFKCP